MAHSPAIIANNTSGYDGGRLKMLERLTGPRAALVAALAMMWLNYAFTSRWAHIPGSVHGPKKPLFVGLLILTTALALMPWPAPSARLTTAPALMPWPAPRARLGWPARIAGWSGVVALIVLFFIWFPLPTWTEIPFLDNWPARFQSTMDGIGLLRRGAFVGWQWHYLGGYHLSSDVTQSHAVLAFIPVLLAGPAVGFHVLLLALFLSLPLLVFLDLRQPPSGENADTAYIAAGLTAIATAGFSYLLLRSGDTNSLAGVACTMLALTASGAAARGTRWGGPLLLAALVLLNYVHAGFLLYAAFFLVLEALFYRDLTRLARALLATAVAVVAGLPQHWESWRYPDYFIPNNVVLDQANEFLWLPFLRKVYYNIELLWLPGRWFNDFSGLAGVCLPITAFIAWHVRSRAGLYAWIALAVMALMRFNTPEFAYLFLRPIHVLAVCLGPILAVFVTRFIGRKALGLCFVALAAVYLQVLVFHVPHIRTLRDADATLVDRVAQLDGALVLVENTPHRDMDADPTRTTEPPPGAAHVEQVLGAATRRRIYGGLWDGWQWSPYRIQVLAGGAFKGRAIATVPVEELRDELGKWGIRHLIVWSQATLDYLRSHKELFAERWVSAPWHEFEYLDADTRTVATTTGTGRLVSFDPLGARIELDGIRAGDNVVVTTNYHPSWTAHVEGTGVDIPLERANGQLGFRAPADGSYAVMLVYPRRGWLSVLALAGLLAGGAILSRWPGVT